MIVAPFPCTEWEKIPLVRLAILLQQQPEFNDVNCDVECTKEAWDAKGRKEWPSNLELTKTYKTKKVSIYISLEEDTHYIIVWCARKKMPNGRRRWKSKGRSFGTYAKTIGQIGIEYQIACAELESVIQAEEKIKREDEESTQMRIATANKLGVTLTKHSYAKTVWNYRDGMTYSLSFERVQPDNGEELFAISAFCGVYTLEEIKAVMQIVALNPRAIAERLHAE